MNTVAKGSYGAWSENNSASETTLVSQDYCPDLSLSKAPVASMVAMQVVSDTAESTLVLTCPMSDLPEVEAPMKVTKLPETGIGYGSAGSILLGAAMVSMILLGAGGVGVLRKGQR